MGKIIAVTNHKGGVGKTTTAVNVSAGIGKLGKRCLLVDVDPQGNATSGVGIDKRQIKYSSYDILIEGVKAEEAILHTEYESLDIIPSNIELADMETQLVTTMMEKSSSVFVKSLTIQP